MQTQNCAVGVDLGSSRFLVAAAKAGKVDVLTNESNYRVTPNVITFGDERTVGDMALTKIKKEIRNSILNCPRFLGDLYKEKADREGFFNFSKLVQKNELKSNFVVNSSGESIEVTPEQAVGALFSKIKQIAKINGVVCASLVVSVPDYFGPPERQAVLDAARIGGLEITQLMNESSATVLNYGIFRKADLDATNPRLVVFADVGHSKTSVFAAKVYKDKAEIISQVSDANLGMRDIDLCLFSYYSEMILKKTGQLVADLPKSKYRLLEAIEKQRKVLTANSEASISVDCIIGEIDFNHFLKRDDFITICAPVFERFGQFFQMVKRELGNIQIHSLEKIGGGTRVPHIEKILANAFGVESVSKTLDAGECVARGCTIRSAMVSPLFKVAEYQIKDRLSTDIRARMKYESDPNVKDAVMFPLGSESNKTMSITLAKNEKLFFELKSNRPLIVGEVEKSNPRSEKFEAKVVFNMDPNFIIRADRAEIKETFIDPGMEVEGEEKKENKPKERVETRTIPLTQNSYFGLDRNALADFQAIENRHLAHEEMLQETHKAKYSLESFIYETRDNIQKENLYNLTTNVEKEQMGQALSEAENWLYEHGQGTSKDVYNSTLAGLKSKVQAFLNRKSKIDDFENFIYDAPKQIDSIVNAKKVIEAAPADKQQKISQLLQSCTDITKQMKTVLDKVNPQSVDSFDYFGLKTKFGNQIVELNQIIRDVERAIKEEEDKKKREEAEKLRKAEEAKKKEEEDKQKAAEAAKQPAPAEPPK